MKEQSLFNFPMIAMGNKVLKVGNKSWKHIQIHFVVQDRSCSQLSQKRQYDLPLAFVFPSEAPEEFWPSAARRATRCNVYPSSKSCGCQDTTGDRIWMERNKHIGKVNDTTKHFRSIQVGKWKKIQNENFE